MGNPDFVGQKMSLPANSMLRGSAEFVGWPKVDGTTQVVFPGVGVSDG